MIMKEASPKLFEEARTYFYLTRRCNNNCPHCYINLPLDAIAKEKELTVESWCNIIDQLCANNLNYLAFTGGEITVYPGFKEVYLYAKRKGMKIHLMTNATNFDEETKSILYKYPPYQISVTIYGVDEETYTIVTGNKNGWTEFSKNLIFLKKLQKEKGTIFELTSVFTKDTIKFQEKTSELGRIYSGEKPGYIKFLYGRTDKNVERNKMIEMKRLSKEQLKMVLTEEEKGKDPSSNSIFITKDLNYNVMFNCSLRRQKTMYFFEDGTMSYCIIMPEGEYVLKPTEEELKNFDYKKMEEKLSLKLEPLLHLKTDEKCVNCILRGRCLTCPIRNLLSYGEMKEYEQGACLKELL